MNIKPNLLCLLLWLSFPSGLLAIDNLRAGDMRSVAMGGNEVVSSALSNPALVALAQTGSLQFTYFNRYALPELGTLSGSFYWPNGTLPAGAHIASFGYGGYRESMLRLPFGKKLGKKWVLGISVQYAMLQTALYGDGQPAQLSTDIGVAYSPVGNLLIGLLVMNAPSVSLGREGFMPAGFQAGFQHRLINNVSLSATFTWGELQPPGGGIGVEYAPSGNFSFRAGVKGAPLLPSFGVGYHYSHITIDAASVFHPLLGASSGVGLSYSF